MMWTLPPFPSLDTVTVNSSGIDPFIIMSNYASQTKLGMTLLFLTVNLFYCDHFFMSLNVSLNALF